MIDINELRRLTQAATPGPWIVNASAINELLDRLEAAESDGLEQARLLGMSGEREAALLSKLEAAEKERDALRAKIAEMEKQGPVAFGLYSGWALKPTYLKEHEACEQRDRRQLTADLAGSLEAYRVVPLYALPGAQPAPSVPECPYPCGWRNLLKLAIEDGAYLARSINEDEPVTENARTVTMRTVMHLRDVLMTINKAAAVPKSEGE